MCWLEPSLLLGGRTEDQVAGLLVQPVIRQVLGEPRLAFVQPPQLLLVVGAELFDRACAEKFHLLHLPNLLAEPVAQSGRFQYYVDPSAPAELDRTVGLPLGRIRVHLPVGVRMALAVGHGDDGLSERR